MIRRALLPLAALALLAAAPDPRAAARFPQTVRVGALLGRDVLQPIEAQPVLGHVQGVLRRPDGSLALLLRQGGVFGFGGRDVVVPVDDLALLGEFVTLVGLTPEQFRALPTAEAPGPTLAADDEIRMGLVRPFH